MILAPALSAAQVDDPITRIDRIDETFAVHPFFNWAAEGLEADFRRDAITRARAALHDGTAASYTDAASRAYDARSTGSGDRRHGHTTVSPTRVRNRSNCGTVNSPRTAA